MSDVNEISKSLILNDRTFIAAVKVQCPIYIFHLSMMVKDNDAFYPVDKAIIHYIKQQPMPDTDYLSSLIGMNRNFVDWRIQHLVEDDHALDRNLNLKYFITDKGIRKYFNGEREEVKRSKRIALDGVTLDFLDERIYQESKVEIRSFKPDVNPHMPLLGDADCHVRSLMSKLEFLSPNEKAKYGFDETAHEFTLKAIETKSLDGVEVVFSSCKNDNCWHRELMFKNKPVKIDSVNGILDQFYFYLKDGIVCTNEGYAEKSEEITNFFGRGICELMSNRYHLPSKFIQQSNYSYTSKADETYPLSFNIDSDLFERSGKRRQILSDAINGIILVPVSNGRTNKNSEKKPIIKGVFSIRINHRIESEVETFKAIQEWQNEHGGIDYEFVERYFKGDSNWRKMFLRLQCYNELEEIDNKRFIRDEL